MEKFAVFSRRPAPWLVALTAVVLSLGAMARHTRHHDSMDMLMAVGSDRLGFEAFSRIVAPLGADGYDGQFYYAIAQAPFKKFGPEIDFPNSRH